MTKEKPSITRQKQRKALKKARHFIKEAEEKKKKEIAKFPLDRDPILERMERFIGFDFRSSSNIKIKKPGQEWRYIKVKNIKDKYKEDHLNGKADLSLPLFEHSKWILIDIDDAPSWAPNTVAAHMGGSPHYIEMNPSNKHYHMYFLIDSYINSAGRKQIENFFMINYGFRIEVPDHGQYFRLPFSQEYSRRGTYEPKNKSNIKQVKSIHSCLDLFEYAQPIPIKNILQIHDPEEGARAQFERNHRFYLYGNENSSKTLLDYEYGYGTRHENQMKLAFYCVHRDMEFSEYVSHCYALNDGTSKDMKKWSPKQIEKVLSGFWRNALNNIQKSKTGFNGETTSVCENLNVKLPEDKDTLYEYFKIIYRGYKIGKIGGKKEHDYITAAIEFYWHTLQKQVSEKQNSRRYINRKKLAILDDKAELSTSFLNGLYKKSKRLKNLNVKKVLYLVEHSLLIQRVRLPNGYTHSYEYKKFATHYHCPAVEMDSIQANKRLYNLLVSAKAIFSLIKELPKSEQKTIRTRIHRKIISGLSESHWGHFSNHIANLYKHLDKDISEAFKYYSKINNCKENLKYPFSQSKTRYFKTYTFKRHNRHLDILDKVTIPQGLENTEIFQLLDNKYLTFSQGKPYTLCEYKASTMQYLVENTSIPFFKNLNETNSISVSHPDIDSNNLNKNLSIQSESVSEKERDRIGLYKLYDNKNSETQIHDQTDYIKVKKKVLKIPILCLEFPQYPSEEIKLRYQKSKPRKKNLQFSL